jgi:hypothetical protein
MMRLRRFIALTVLAAAGCASHPANEPAMGPLLHPQATDAPDQQSQPVTLSLPLPAAMHVGRYGSIPQTTPSRRPIGLREAIALSLETSPVIKTLSGGAVFNAPATHYDPVIRDLRVGFEQAAFDPQFTGEVLGTRFDEPPDNFDPTDTTDSAMRDEVFARAELAKRWQLGTRTSIAYQPPLAYLYLPDTDTTDFNPAVGVGLVLEARQPLLRGAGVDVNAAPIRIARLQADQSGWEVKEAVLAQVRSVEEAYWELQAAYTVQQAFDAVLPLLDDAVCRSRSPTASSSGTVISTRRFETSSTRQTSAPFAASWPIFSRIRGVQTTPAAGAFTTSLVCSSR